MYSTGMAAAFTADSFVVDTDTYLFESIQASNFSLRDSSSAYAVSPASTNSTSSDTYSFGDLLPLFSTPSKIGIYASVFHKGETILDVTVPDWYEDRIYPSNGSSPSYFFDSNHGVFYFTTSVPSQINGGTVESLGTPCFNLSNKSFSRRFIIDLDLSSMGSFNSFSLSGILATTADTCLNSPIQSLGIAFPESFSIEVNGSVYRNIILNGSSSQIELSDFIYSGSSPVTSIRFYIDFSLRTFSYTSDRLRARVNLNSDSTLSLSVLSDNNVLDGFNDNAQNAINQQEAIESQWTGSMTDNFNNLSLSDFTFPVAAVNGFSLISGIFNDLWNAMGDFRIVYVFPLTLGVVLLLIGRLSRTSVKRSSGRGDDDA